ncbi:MAG: DUF2116 family Zn-ribbon domain-containing protein [Thermoplasmata archaeon]
MDVENHRHCKVCGKVCATNVDTCSRACEEQRENTLRSKRTWTNLLYILIVVFAFLFLVEILR